MNPIPRRAAHLHLVPAGGEAETPHPLSATREPAAAERRGPETLRWAACFALALGLHAAAAGALLGRWNDPPDSVANAPVIMIELATLPVAPETKPTQVPPGRQQEPTQPQLETVKPVEKSVEKQIEKPPEKTVERPREMQAEQPLAAPPRELQAELQQPVLPPPKPIEKPVEKSVERPLEKPLEKKLKPRHASLASAPSTAERKAARAAAPMPGAASRNPDAVPNWKSQLVARLERYKRYPPDAQSRGEQGVAQLAFSIDRSGGVHHAHILRSSGSSLLDAATLELVERAAPLPAPPPEISGTQIAIVVPIRYNLR